LDWQKNPDWEKTFLTLPIQIWPTQKSQLANVLFDVVNASLIPWLLGSTQSPTLVVAILIFLPS